MGAEKFLKMESMFKSAGSRGSGMWLYGSSCSLCTRGQVERSHSMADVEEDSLPIHPPTLQNPASPLDSQKDEGPEVLASP